MSEPVEQEKRVTWAELFFDLVFVFAVTEVSTLLQQDHSWAGVGRALVAFVPVYWGWVGMSVHANTHEVDNPLDRIGIFAAGLCGLFMALAIPAAYDGRGVLFGVAYYALRLVLAVLVFHGRRMALGPFSIAVLITGPLLVVGGVLHGPWRVGLWAFAALVDLATPLLTRRRLVGMRFHAAHLPERFGLFLIIALGESIVAIGGPAAALEHLDGQTVVAVAEAFALACGLWWVYFGFAASAMRYSLETAKVQSDVVRQILTYSHLALIGGIIAVAVGMAAAVAHPAASLTNGAEGLLFGGCALYLATFGYTRWRMFRRWSVTRLGAAVIVVALIPVGGRLSALAALGLLLMVVAALNVMEHVRVTRHQRAGEKRAEDRPGELETGVEL